MTRIHLIDFLVVSWMVATIVLLFVFARYSIRCWRQVGLAGAYDKISFFNGLIIHHTGNLVLLAWFWNKVHRGELSLQMRDLDAWTLIVGSAIAVCGVLYKVRIFTDSLTEVGVTAALTFVLSALSIFTIYFN